MKIHTVPEGVARTPLAKYLQRAWPMLPGWVIRDAIKTKSVRINGVRGGADAAVCAGDELKIYILDQYFEAPLDIIYEDDGLLVVNKPAGLPVDADQRSVGADTLKSRVQAYCASAQLCHRLDTGTSGIVLCAKNEKAHEQMLHAFASHELRKKYRCIVGGRMSYENQTLKAWLKKDAGAAKVRVIDHPAPGAQEIRTQYRLLNVLQKNGATLSELEVTLITGRTHQIRAHMAHVDHPLLGDDKYGDRSLNKKFSTGICLHAAELTLLGEDVPDKWQGMTFKCPAPQWLSDGKKR